MADFNNISPEQKEILDKLVKRINFLVYASAVIVIFVLFNLMAPDTAYRLMSSKASEGEQSSELVKVDDDLIEDGVHVASGLIVDEGFIQVKASCTSCHSGKLITQNRATRKGWKKMIIWMQETQNLWDLGQNEDIILDYLAKNYAPEDKGRRPNLTNIEWYTLDN